VDTRAVRAAFDAQIRRNTRADEPGAVVEAGAGVLRWLAPGTQTSCITWSELTSDSADAVIAAQVRYFAARGTPVEWKLYDYDQPADLAQRLLAAGFVADDEELMLVAETAAIDPDVKLPDGVRLDLVTDHAGVEAMVAVHDLAFTGHPSPELGERLVIQLREAPELVQAGCRHHPLRVDAAGQSVSRRAPARQADADAGVTARWIAEHRASVCAQIAQSGVACRPAVSFGVAHTIRLARPVGLPIAATFGRCASRADGLCCECPVCVA
jgi:hypothetical protein